MKPIQRLIPWLAVALVACLLWIFWPTESGRISEKTNQTPGERFRPGSHDGKPDARIRQNPSEAASPEVSRLIERSLTRLLASKGPEESSSILQDLRDGIRTADDSATVSAISGFLKSGQDAPTLLPFAVGPGGVMESTPTLRTALLDLLVSLDPTAALEVARVVMDLKKSPEEYALALRNLAWNDLNGDLKDELSDRLEQLMETKVWRQNPSAGFLEGLDAAVAISDVKTFVNMLNMSAESAKIGNSSLARASFLILDRMVVRDPQLLVKTYDSNPALSGIPPGHRASLMSRLDLADPVQRELFVAYLAESGHGPGELDYFADLFPNGNYLHGNWLITSLETTHSIDSRFKADQKVIEEIERMIAGNANEQTNQTLVRIRDRLQKVTAKETKK